MPTISCSQLLDSTVMYLHACKHREAGFCTNKCLLHGDPRYCSVQREPAPVAVSRPASSPGQPCTMGSVIHAAAWT